MVNNSRHETSCNCVPEIEYLCSLHRKPNQCGGCNRTDQKLYISGIGLLCKDCQRKNGVIFA